MGDILNRGTKLAPLWYCRYVELDGNRVQRPTGAATKPEARAVLDGYEDRVRQGLVGCPRKDRGVTRDAVKAKAVVKAARASVTLEDLARRFLGEVEGDPGYCPPRIKHLVRYRRDARSLLKQRLLPTLRGKPAVEITAHDVERLRDTLLKKRAPVSVMNALGLLSKIFNWSRRCGLIDCQNPASGVERPRASHSLDFLSETEVAALLATAQRTAVVGVASWQMLTLAPLAATAVFTGMRRGELAGLRWQDVDLDATRIDVMRSYRMLPKSGKPRHVGLHPDLAVILRAWKKLCPETKEGLVFPVRDDGPKTRWRMATAHYGMGLVALLKFAGCHLPADGKPFHYLRHTFASSFVMRGGSLYALQQLMGHSTPVMSARYAHLSPAHLGSEVARLRFAAPLPADVSDMAEERRRRASGEAE